MNLWIKNSSKNKCIYFDNSSLPQASDLTHHLKKPSRYESDILAWATQLNYKNLLVLFSITDISNIISSTMTVH